MVKLIVLLRTGARPPQYEEGYNHFLMLLEKLPGIRKKAVNSVYSGPGGLMPYRTVIEVYFDDRAALEAALTSEAGVEAGNALFNFAGPDAITLFADVMEEAFDGPDAAAPLD
ncbi:MAG TPA: EthD family reductase [Chloroflexi bacterium]|nr:EthD family reductase [Chloroflexota bacterium]